jgi:hypothetical protein
MPVVTLPSEHSSSDLEVAQQLADKLHVEEIHVFMSLGPAPLRLRRVESRLKRFARRLGWGWLGDREATTPLEREVGHPLPDQGWAGP